MKDNRAIMLKCDREGALTSQLQSNEISIKESEYQFVDKRNSEESGLWSDYYSLLNQEDQIEIERLNVKIAENDHKLVTTKLNQGLAKSVDERNARLSLENAKTALQNAIDAYMRQSEDFSARLA